MRRTAAVLISVIVLGYISAVPTNADDDLSRRSMVGIRGVEVTVSITCDESAFNHLVTNESLKTTIELRLRQLGVRVLSASEAASDPRFATLDLKLIAVAACGNIQGTTEPVSYAISTRLSLNQALWVVDKGVPKRVQFGDTWSRDYALCYGRNTISEGKIEKNASDMADAFANDWLAAHGK